MNCILKTKPQSRPLALGHDQHGNPIWPGTSWNLSLSAPISSSNRFIKMWQGIDFGQRPRDTKINRTKIKELTRQRRQPIIKSQAYTNTHSGSEKFAACGNFVGVFT